MISKASLRKQILASRDRLPEDNRLSISAVIADKFLSTDFYKDSRVIWAYWPFGSEINTAPIVHRALSENKKVILPKVEKQKLLLYEIDDPQVQLVPGTYGIMEPVIKGCHPARIKDIDLIMVPGIVFDRKCNRLGYGGGYYDRMLPSLDKAVKIALCFGLQLVDFIPVEKHDIKVDIIITEFEVINCNYKKT